MQEDYSSEQAEDRVMRFMGQFLPPFYAVTRTELLQQWYSLLPPGTSFEWQEIGHAYYMLARAKARILPIPFAVREINYGASEHNTNVLTVLTFKDAKTVAEREQFAEFLASMPTAHSATRILAAGQADCAGQFCRHGRLPDRRSLADKGTRFSVRPGSDAGEGADSRLFGSEQFVEMPFYNKPIFDLLTEFEFLLHAMPAGRLQLAGTGRHFAQAA